MLYKYMLCYAKYIYIVYFCVLFSCGFMVSYIYDTQLNSELAHTVVINTCLHKPVIIQNNNRIPSPEKVTVEKIWMDQTCCRRTECMYLLSDPSHKCCQDFAINLICGIPLTVILCTRRIITNDSQTPRIVK